MRQSNKVRVHKAKLQDASAILECLGAAFAPFREEYTPEAFRDTTLTSETLRQRLQAMSIYVATEESGTIVGTIGGTVTGEEGHIRGMAVLPEWQGRGVAEALLAAIEGELQDRGCAFITLDTTKPLQRAIHFYEKHGYRPSGKVTDFFGMPLFEYVKNLSAT